jgi:uncharacterized membrane protein
MRFENSVTIARPIADVFSYIATVENSPAWQEPVVEAKRLSGEPLGVGSQAAQIITLLGRRYEQLLEITAYDPPQVLAINTVSGPVAASISFTLQEDNQHTHLIVTTEGKPGTALKLAGPFLERMAKRQAQRDLETLKALLER